MKDFQDTVAQHVLERLLAEIDRGETSTIWYTTTNQDGSSNTTSREVNVKHSISSAVIHKLSEDKETMDKLQKKLDSMIKSQGFQQKVADRVSDKLISWLEEKTSWYPRDEYAHKESFKKEVRQKSIQIIAQKHADIAMAKLTDVAPKPIKKKDR